MDLMRCMIKTVVLCETCGLDEVALFRQMSAADLLHGGISAMPGGRYNQRLLSFRSLENYSI
jgi:hypothetical protein